MKNLFYFIPSIKRPCRTMLMNESGYSPMNLGYGYYLTSYTEGGQLYYSININSSEISVVERIFSQFCSGKSISDIVNELNSENVPTRRKRGWNYLAVSNILKNENYIGSFLFYKYPLTVVDEKLRYFPTRLDRQLKETISDLACISERVWDKAQNIRAKRIERLQKQYKTINELRRKKSLTDSCPSKGQIISNKEARTGSILTTVLRALIPLKIFELTRIGSQLLISNLNDK